MTELGNDVGPTTDEIMALLRLQLQVAGDEAVLELASAVLTEMSVRYGADEVRRVLGGMMDNPRYAELVGQAQEERAAERAEVSDDEG